MATYKVLQDIEAEDKILGPLTLRQFIYGLISVFFLYISFIVLTKGAPFLLIVFLPPALFTGFFAFPFVRDQPTEVWALAKIRFLFKPRLRLWDQSGVKELVSITVPKRVEQFLTNGLSPNEVQSRLKALADTIDSRGWAIKNVNVNLYSPTVLNTTDSDRLIDISNMPREVPSYDVTPSDDILDEANNPIAHQFDSMINASTQTHHQKLIDELNTIRAQQAATQATAPNDYWFMNQSVAPVDLPASQAMFSAAQVVQPGTDAMPAATPLSEADEAALAAQLKAKNTSQQVSYSHLRTIQPLGNGQDTVTIDHQPAVNQPANPSPTGHNPAIISLANNNDLNVATLAREAYKAKSSNEPPEGEVVISLR